MTKPSNYQTIQETWTLKFIGSSFGDIYAYHVTNPSAELKQTFLGFL